MITKVTITGADDSITPAELMLLGEEFPFVEWGILFSNQFGNPRFPSLEWIDDLLEIATNETNLSLHLCGRYVRDLLLGNDHFSQDIPVNCFKRIQINTHGRTHTTAGFLAEVLRKYPDVQWIFQYDNVNTRFIDLLKGSDINHAALFDLSHGAGLLPSKWPDPLRVPCGYAGGLSPDNLIDQIHKIEEKAGSAEIWIDMETHVRSNMDQKFDLQKVRKCLEISANHIAVSKA